MYGNRGVVITLPVGPALGNQHLKLTLMIEVSVTEMMIMDTDCIVDR